MDPKREEIGYNKWYRLILLDASLLFYNNLLRLCLIFSSLSS